MPLPLVAPVLIGCGLVNAAPVIGAAAKEVVDVVGDIFDSDEEEDES